MTDAAEHPRLDVLLQTWAAWLSRDGLQDLRCATSRYWSAGSRDFDDMLDDVDDEQAAIVDALVWSLPTALRAAVLSVHAASVWRFRRESLDDAYARARQSLSAALRRRGVP